MSRYVKELLSYPSLDRKVMFNYAKILEVSNDENQRRYVKGELIKAFSKLSVKWAIFYAKKYHPLNYDEVIDDLSSQGIIAIHKALKKYNPNLGVHFYSYVDRFIMWEVRWAAIRLKNIIHIPCNAAALDPKNWHHRVLGNIFDGIVAEGIDNITPYDNCKSSSIENTILEVIDSMSNGEVLKLKYVEGKTYKQISELTGIQRCKISIIVKEGTIELQNRLKELKEEYYGKSSVE